MVRAFSSHATVALLLSSLLGTASGYAEEVQKPAVYDASSSAPGKSAAVEKSLDKAISVNFDGMILQGLVDFLDEHGIDAYLDTKAIEESGMGSDTPLADLKLRDVSIRAALNLVLHTLDMQFVITHGKLRITTTDVADVELNTRIYNVVDLVRHIDQDGTIHDHYDGLVELIVTSVDPQTWDEVGGPSSIGTFQGTLIVSQTDPSHAKTGWLLTALRECRASQLAGAKPQVIWSDSPRMLTMRRTFAEKSQAVGDYSFTEVPLAEAVARIGERSGVQTMLDVRALEEAGMGADTPVTAELRQVTLPVALAMLLEPFDMTYRLSDEVVLITTTDVASQMLTLGVYPVADLVQFGRLKVGGAKQDFQSLTDVLSSTILPSSWNQVGGPATIEPFFATSALVVDQQPEAHEDVERLLAGLRQLRTAPPSSEQTAKKAADSAEPVNVAYDKEFVSRTFHLTGAQDSQFVIGQIRAIEQDQWHGDGAVVRTAGAKLYLRNTRAAQQRALLRLREMQAVKSVPQRSNLGMF